MYIRSFYGLHTCGCDSADNVMHSSTPWSIPKVWGDNVGWMTSTMSMQADNRIHDRPTQDKCHTCTHDIHFNSRPSHYHAPQDSWELVAYRQGELTIIIHAHKLWVYGQTYWHLCYCVCDFWSTSGTNHHLHRLVFSAENNGGCDRWDRTFPWLDAVWIFCDEVDGVLTSHRDSKVGHLVVEDDATRSWSY